MFQGLIGNSSLSLAQGVPVQTNLSVREITQLDKYEPYTDAQVFHAGLLWVGRSRINANTAYQVEAYDPAGQPVGNPLSLRHTPSYLYPFGTDSIIVVGKSATPNWKTHYSIVSVHHGQLSSLTYTFPEEIQADRFAGDSDHLFFSEPGDGALFTLPQWSLPHQAQFLAPTIHGPGPMLFTEGNLFVVEQNNILSSTQGNLIKLNPYTQTAERVFSQSNRKALTALVKLPGSSRIAITEQGANQVLLVHTDTNSVNEKENIPVAGRPWGITLYGSKCIAVLAYNDHAVRFFDVSQPASPEVADWNLMNTINRFHRPRVLSADPQSGKLYIRSDEICPSCQTSFNREFLVEEPGGATLAQCR